MTDHGDPNLSSELAGLQPPEHLPGFWEELDRELKTISSDRPSGGPWPDQPRHRLLAAAAAVLVAVGLTGLVWRQVGPARIETGGPFVEGTGGVEGPFAWMVQGSHDGRELLLSRPIDGDGTRCFETDDDDHLYEILSLTLDGADGAPQAVSLTEVVGSGRFYERLVTPGPGGRYAVHNLCARDGQRVAVSAGPPGGSSDGLPHSTTDLTVPADYPYLLSPAVWQILEGQPRLVVTFYDAPEDGDGPIARLRTTVDPATGKTLSGDPVDATLLAVLADGTTVEKTDTELVVGGRSAETDYEVFVDEVEAAPDGSAVAVFGYTPGSGIVVFDGDGRPRYEDLTGPVVDVAWLPDGRMVVAKGGRPDPSNFEIVDLRGPEPTVMAFDPGLGPIVSESITAVVGDRLAISGTTRAARDSTWFVPLPSSDGEPGTDVGSGDDLATLIPDPALLGRVGAEAASPYSSRGPSCSIRPKTPERSAVPRPGSSSRPATSQSTASARAPMMRWSSRPRARSRRWWSCSSASSR